LNATALQIALQKMKDGVLGLDFFRQKLLAERTKIAAGVIQDRNPVLSETTGLR
jgi:hypothetical protein